MNNISSIKLCNYNNIYFGKNKKRTDNKIKKNYNTAKKNIIIKSLIGITLASTAAAILIKSGKLNNKNKKIINTDTTKTTINKKITSLKDLIFSKGIAKDKNGQAFSGTIEHIDLNGKKFELTFENGSIKKSIKKGEEGFTKTYKKNLITAKFNNGAKIEVENKGKSSLEIRIDNLDNIYHSEKTYNKSGVLIRHTTIYKNDLLAKQLTTEDVVDETSNKNNGLFKNIISRIKENFRSRFPKKPKVILFWYLIFKLNYSITTSG